MLHTSRSRRPTCNQLAFPATSRTCHKKCKCGEHFFRHVLLTPSADNHPATKHSPSHKTPCCHACCGDGEQQSRPHPQRKPPNTAAIKRSVSRRLPPSLQRNNRNDSVGILRARRAVAELLNPPPWFPPSGHPLSEAPPFKGGNPPRGETHPGGNSTALFCFIVAALHSESIQHRPNTASTEHSHCLGIHHHSAAQLTPNPGHRGRGDLPPARSSHGSSYSKESQ